MYFFYGDLTYVPTLQIMCILQHGSYYIIKLSCESTSAIIVKAKGFYDLIDFYLELNQS